MQKDIKVYIAAPFFTEKQLGVVMRLESELVVKNIESYSPRTEGVIKSFTKEQKVNQVRTIFYKNIQMLDWSTHIVAIIDNYDTGTVWEMGYAYKAGKKIITYSDCYYSINVMLNESIVNHCVSMLDIVPAIMNDNYITEKPETET